ncbi:DUF732 domain-containing protein [Mycobacterium sp.]|uniref:DUF732 domain-containing protein n=1 Tax=Mycobacterium sp. TaxID=1785 RepID=UPI003C734AA8
MTITRIRRSIPLLSPSTAVPVLVFWLLGALGTAATAHADANDDAFVTALQAKDITFESREAAITSGRLVCHELDLGQSPEQVANDVLNSSHLDGYHAGYFVGVSIRAYCPNYASRT